LFLKLTGAVSFVPVCIHTRTACKYGGKNIAFRVNEGSTNFWLSLLVEFEDGEGDIGSMQIKQVTSPAQKFKLIEITTGNLSRSTT
jgi:hypothetical protein